MKRGVWVGSLVLSLGGWAAELLAQEGAWRPAASGPVPIVLAPSELKPCPAATIGRPIPITTEPTFDPSFLLPSTGLLPVVYQQPVFPPGAAAPSAKEIPGGDKLPTWNDVDDEPKAHSRTTDDNDFAIDRWQPALPPSTNTSPLKQVSLTTDAPDGPVLGPPTPVPPMPTTYPLDGDPFHTNPFLLPPNQGPPPYAPYGDNPHQANPLYSHFYANAEYLLWWIKRDTAPPLVTSSPDTNGNFGFLGQPGTNVLFGGPYGSDPYSGFRASAGYWLDTWCEEAIEFGGFFLGDRSTKFGAASGPNSVLARPFTDVNSNSQTSELVGAPGISTGRVNITAPSSLWGLDTNLRCNLCMSCNYRLDMLFGFRYLNLDESMDIGESIQGEAGAPAPFTNALTTVSDHFETRNQFYGAQIGLVSEWKQGPWSLDLTGKLALGATNQLISIAGSETIVAPNGTSTSFNGGLLALPSNIGNHNQTHFSVVPEVGLTLGYQLTDMVRLYAGYNFLYWTDVVRPGQQINTNLDVTQIPNFNVAGAKPTGLNVPSVPFKESDFWAQGIVVGFEIRY
jgi:Putative beta barrel porin-7 (BBP7)